MTATKKSRTKKKLPALTIKGATQIDQLWHALDEVRDNLRAIAEAESGRGAILTAINLSLMVIDGLYERASSVAAATLVIVYENLDEIQIRILRHSVSKRRHYLNMLIDKHGDLIDDRIDDCLAACDQIIAKLPPQHHAATSRGGIG